jgi:hypothetical protein
MRLRRMFAAEEEWMNLLRSRCLAAVGVSAALALLPLTAGPASASAAAPAPSPMAAAAAAAAAAGFPLSRTLPESASVPACTMAGAGKVLCTSATPTQAAAPQIPLAGFCIANKVHRNRHESCGVFGVRITLFEVPSGKVLGTADVAVVYAAALSASSRSWNMPMAIEMTSASAALRVGTVADTAIVCTGGCIGPPIWTAALRVGVVDRHTFVIRAPGSATITTTQTPLVIFTHPAAENSAPVSFRDLGPARCDSVAVARTSGCVFSDEIAEYVLHLHRQNVDAVAAHIQTAQRTKPHHFGLIGHFPLTRDTSAADQRRNRAAACRNFHSPGLTCDEYPFAATHQGAAFFPGDNSTFGVPGSQNSAEGGRRVSMYRTERLLNGDRFWVIILP